MPAYIVSYDKNAGDDYTKLTKALDAYGGWHCLGSTWIIITNSTAVQIRDNLKQYLDQNDKLIIVKSGGEWASIGFNDKCHTWLNNNL